MTFISKANIPRCFPIPQQILSKTTKAFSWVLMSTFHIHTLELFLWLSRGEYQVTSPLEINPFLATPVSPYRGSEQQAKKKTHQTIPQLTTLPMDVPTTTSMEALLSVCVYELWNGHENMGLCCFFWLIGVVMLQSWKNGKCPQQPIWKTLPKEGVCELWNAWK